MLFPKRVKYRKQQKGRRRLRTFESRGTQINFGSFGLKADGLKYISSKQIEACRRAIMKYLKKGGKLWIRIFPDKAITTKGVETPMGGGKGAPDHYVFAVKPGRMLFELEGVTETIAKEAFRKAGDKLSVKTKFVKKA